LTLPVPQRLFLLLWSAVAGRAGALTQTTKLVAVAVPERLVTVWFRLKGKRTLERVELPILVIPTTVVARPPTPRFMLRVAREVWEVITLLRL
jgi:hypothetical protein